MIEWKEGYGPWWEAEFIGCLLVAAQTASGSTMWEASAEHPTMGRERKVVEGLAAAKDHCTKLARALAGAPGETPDEREAAIVRRLAGEWGEYDVGPTESIDDVIAHIEGVFAWVMQLIYARSDWDDWGAKHLGMTRHDAARMKPGAMRAKLDARLTRPMPISLDLATVVVAGDEPLPPEDRCEGVIVGDVRVRWNDATDETTLPVQCLRVAIPPSGAAEPTRDGRPDFAGFAAACRAEAEGSRRIHGDEAEGEVASLLRVAEMVERVADALRATPKPPAPPEDRNTDGGPDV